MFDIWPNALNKAHHTFVPDKRHSLFSAIGSLWDQSEVIFTNCTLGSLEGAVTAACYLEVSTRPEK